MKNLLFTYANIDFLTNMLKSMWVLVGSRTSKPFYHGFISCTYLIYRKPGNPS